MKLEKLVSDVVSAEEDLKQAGNEFQWQGKQWAKVLGQN